MTAATATRITVVRNCSVWELGTGLPCPHIGRYQDPGTGVWLCKVHRPRFSHRRRPS